MLQDTPAGGIGIQLLTELPFTTVFTATQLVLQREQIGDDPVDVGAVNKQLGIGE